jgi:hypothetical protein
VAVGGDVSTTLADRVSAETTRIRPGRIALDVLAAPLWLVGWLAFWTVLLISSTVRWCWAGVRLGWLDGQAQAGRRGYGAGRWPVKVRSGTG